LKEAIANLKIGEKGECEFVMSAKKDQSGVSTWTNAGCQRSDRGEKVRKDSVATKQGRKEKK